MALLNIYRDAAHQAAATIIQPTDAAIDALADQGETLVADRDATISTTQADLTKSLEDLAAANALLTQALTTSEARRLALLQSDATLLATQRQISPIGLSDIEKHPDWRSNTGDTIGSTAPKVVVFTNMDVPDAQGTPRMMAAPDGTRGVMKFTAQQDVGSYGDVLISKKCPAPAPGQKTLRYRGQFWITPETPLAWEALEIDNKVIIPDPADALKKWLQNFSSHIDQFGELCISGDTPWKKTGIKLGGIPAAGMWHSFEWEYAWDAAAHTYTFVAFTFDGKRYLIPTSFANMAASISDWGSFQIHPQLQWSLNQSGKTATGYFLGLRYGS